MLNNLLALNHEEIEALLKLQTIFLSDSPLRHEELDYVFVVSQTPNNQKSVLERTVQIYNESVSDLRVVLGDVKNPPACRHADQIISELTGELVLREDILVIDFPDDGIPLNTYTEMVGLVQWLADLKFTCTVGIIASPFHQLRSMLSVLSAQEQSNDPRTKNIKFLSVPGTSLLWNQESVHSQGILTGKRHEFISTELERVAKFYLKGDLIAPTRALEIYLNQ